MLDRKKLLENRQLFISCVVPVHNEQENITDFINTLRDELSKASDNFEIIIVDDGSKDHTLEKINDILDDHIKVIVLARNFGKENALTAGLDHCKGDITILTDADFQHPVELISTFLRHWVEGFDMVYGVRENREKESFFKRLFSNLFYRLIARISDVDIPANAGDFRLLDKKVVEALNTMGERNRFMKGMYAWVGFKSLSVPFTVAERPSGKSSWGFFKLMELALTGITSFSDIPLRVWSLLGFIISMISLIYGLYIVLKTFIIGVDIPGYATIIVGIMFLGGVQLFSIGVLGEYLARIFTEVKQRPKYIVAKKIGFK